MTIANQQCLEAGRRATREQLLKVLLRSNARQQQVARRRVAWRMAQRTLIVAVVSVGGVVATYWALTYSGVIPHLAIVVDAGELAPAPPAPPAKAQAQAPAPAPAPTQPPPMAPATQEPLDLRLDTQLTGLGATANTQQATLFTGNSP